MPIFQPFNSLHLQILGIILLCWIFIPFIGLKYFNSKVVLYTSWLFAFLTFGQEMSMIWFRLDNGSFDISKNLPIHLCSFAVFCSSYALITKNQTAFELAFFWGLAGTFQSLMTPTPEKPFPNLEFNIFFFSHAMIILNVLWLVTVQKMKLRKSIWIRVFIITNSLAVIIGCTNWFLKSSYMYLCQKPPVNHVLLIGKEPFHIVTFEISAILFFYGLYRVMLKFDRVHLNERISA